MALAGLAAPAVVHASTATIGSPNLATESPDDAQNCDSFGCTQALTQLGSDQVTAPCAGTITQWSVRAYVFSPDVTDNIELRVLVPFSGGTYGAVGTSAPIVVTTTDMVHTASADLPIAQGDIIALEVPDNRVNTVYGESSSAGYEVWDPPLVDGAEPSAPSFGGVGSSELLISAVVACTETLTVTNAQPAAGVVKSGDGSIDCGSTCSHGYPSGASVTLTETPNPGYEFAGWSGACTGLGACVVTVSSAEAVTASFTRVPPPPPPPPPNTAITRATISAKHQQAKFTFKAAGIATGFQCALIKLPKHGSAPRARFSACGSPKAYTRLRPAKYEFFVRAFNSTGPDPTPASKKFSIPTPPRHHK
jgi:Divergent InlB B-repeat domain